MSRTIRFILPALAAALAITLAGPALAQQDAAQPDRNRNPQGRRNGNRAERPEGAERGDRDNMRAFYEKRQMERLMEDLRQGRPIDPRMERMFERLIGSSLLRSPGMNPIDLAHYSVAEIHLQQKEVDNCLKRLQTVIEAHKEQQNETVWVTHLNLGLLYSKLRGDIQQSLTHLKQVQGLWAAFARRQLLKTYEEAGQLEAAVALLKTENQGVEEKGARLAMLRSIAELYQRNEERQKAIEYYDKITKEFTPDDVAGMVKAAEAEVKQYADQVTALLKENRREEVEQIIRKAENRLSALRAQDRREEAEAFERAMHAARERIEQQRREERQPPRHDAPPGDD